MKKRMISFFIIAAFILTAVPMLGLTAFAADTLDYGATTTNEEDVLHVYDKLKSGVDKDAPDEKIVFDPDYNINRDELDKGVALFISDHPECFWFKHHYSYMPISLGSSRVAYITPKYSFDGDALAISEAKKELDNVVSGIIRGLPSGSNYDKALYLHDALANITEYEQVGEHQTAYGALVSGKAVCAGYAAAYQLLLEEAGIVAWTVTGQSRGIPHAWNLVWLDADTCVYTDVTWDDQSDDIFHYYFNLSKSEMEADHTVDSNKFALPECEHLGESYFDRTALEMTDKTSVEELLPLFGPAINGARSAKIYYTGSSFSTWMARNGNRLYRALGGNGISPRYSYDSLGKEIHLTITGGFITNAYRVNISAGFNLSFYEDCEQYVRIGEAMEQIVFTAAVGYYFPEDYSVASKGGITVTRLDSRHVVVSGTPTYNNINITVPEPARMTAKDTPEVTFSAISDRSGLLLGVEDGMKYSFDAENWTDVTSNEPLLLEGLYEGYVYVIRKGDGEGTYDSEPQRISIGKAAMPSLSVTQPTEIGGKGSINTTESQEYSTDGVEWKDCNGTLTGLDAGRYYVREKANGNILASYVLELDVIEYTLPPPEKEEADKEEANGDSATEDTGAADTEKVSTEQTKGTGAFEGFSPISCKSSLENGGAVLSALLVLTAILTLGFKRKSER